MEIYLRLRRLNKKECGRIVQQRSRVSERFWLTATEEVVIGGGSKKKKSIMQMIPPSFEI